MSVRLMGQIWDLDIRPQGKKLVLLAFADAANDDGLTWIAIESQRGKRSICTKSSATVRSVQAHVSQLEADGYLERNETVGRGCLWRVNATPAKLAGVHGATPAIFAPPPAEFAGEPSINRHEQETAGERVTVEGGQCPISQRPLPAGVSLEQWEAFLDMRTSIAKPVLTYAAAILLAKLQEIADAGWHAGDALDRSTVNAWADVYEPEAGRVTRVRCVVAGQAADPVGMSDADKAELIRIAAIEDMGEKLAARREFMAEVERRNAPEPLGMLAGMLPLRLPPGTQNAFVCRRKPKS